MSGQYLESVQRIQQIRAIDMHLLTHDMDDEILQGELGCWCVYLERKLWPC